MKCCSISSTEIKNLECPRCNQNGSIVQVVTLHHQVLPQYKEHVSEVSNYYFCPTPACEVVYFGADFVFTTNHLIEKVTIKDNALNVKVCYCFNYTRADLIKSLQNCNSNLVDKIKLHIKNESCFCERTNPEGVCCLRRINLLAASEFLHK